VVATLNERKPGVWYARTFLPPRGDQKGRQVGKVFRGTKKDVALRVAEWEAQLRGTTPAAVGATVADLLALWQKAKEFDWQPTTRAAYVTRSKAVIAELGTVRLVDLDPFIIDDWLNRLRRRGVGAGTVRSQVSALRAATTWGISRRMLRTNAVAEAAPRLPVGRRSVRPEPEQVVAIIAAAAEEETRAALAMRLAAVAGAREAEMVALQWDDLVGNDLRIGRQRHSMDGETLVRDRTKTGGRRTVTLDPGTVAAIKAWRKECDEIVGAPTTWMLAPPGADSPPSPRWFYEVFCRAADRAGVPRGRKAGIVPHDFRHWAASTALRDGHDPVSVAARLGHSPETLLRIYAQEIEQGQEGVAASLASRLDPKPG